MNKHNTKDKNADLDGSHNKSKGFLKKTLGTLVAGIFAAQIGCAPVMNYVNRQRPPSALDNISQSVVCIRTEAVYTNESDATDKHGVKGTGSGFVFAYEDGYSYIVTAKHVAVDEEEFTVEGAQIIVPHPESGEVIVLPLEITYKKTSANLRIADNVFDEDKSDDIPLELLASSPDSDISILRAKAKLPVATNYIMGDTRGLRTGDQVYVAGFPHGFFPFVSEGIVSNNGIRFPGEKTGYIVINSTFISGQSGGPFFSEHQGTLYFMGICGMGILHDGETPVDITLCTDINYFEDMLDTSQYQNRNSTNDLLPNLNARKSSIFGMLRIFDSKQVGVSYGGRPEMVVSPTLR